MGRPWRQLGSLLMAGALCQALPAIAQDEHFEIRRFAVEGNTLLSAAHVDGLLEPYTGGSRVYGDVQRALEALEHAYRSAGYSSVQVQVPEQELTQGIVRLVVRESVIGRVTVQGHRRFSTQNVRAALPALQEGVAPNARRLSENIQLANDSPAKQVAVTLAAGDAPNTIDAHVAVSEEPPQKIILTADNTGTQATGRTRLGVAYQHANLFDRDHVLTMAYTFAPDAPDGVKVGVASLAYHLPIYALGDSIDVVYGKSDVNTPSVQATGFGLTGKGDVIALRYNHHFARQGEFSNKLSLGLDYKYFNTRCSINGQPQAIDPPTPALASCTPYTTRPLSLTYAGQWQGAGAVADYQLGLVYNLPLGSSYLFRGGFDRYSTIAGRPVSDDFTLARVSASYMTALPANWLGRVALAGQYGNNGLVSGEQFGLAGASAVRGFGERAVTADIGHLLNLELHTPDVAPLIGLPGSLRGVVFHDLARGQNQGVDAPTPATARRLGIASAGLGLRYALSKEVSVRADLAEVTHAGPTGTAAQGDRAGHVNLSLSF